VHSVLRIIALALLLGGCQCGPARAGVRPIEEGMDATVSRDAGGPSSDAGEATDAGEPDEDAGFTIPDAGPEPEICDDDADNDGDGATDCADPDCDGQICDAMGNPCIDGACNGCRMEATETACGDRADEDCDGLRDCEDPDCDGITCGPAGVVCGGGTCPCPSGFTEWICDDGADDDCDGTIDCADSDCFMRPCDATGARCTTEETCECLGDQEVLCDGLDTDCNGVTDDGCPEGLDLGAPSTQPAVGGTSGTPWVDPCPPGMALMGIAGRASSRIDQLQPICAVVRFRVDESLSMSKPEYSYFVERGSPTPGAIHGQTGAPTFTDECPEGAFAVGIEGHADLSLDRVALRCARYRIVGSLAIGWRLIQEDAGGTPSRGGAGDMGAFMASCPTPGLITALEGRAGSFVTQLAPSCSSLALDLR